jgi:transposase
VAACGQARYGLSEAAWACLAPLLPPAGGGRPWRDHRQVIEGILWVLHTGAPWRDLPSQFGPWQTAYARFTRWRYEGVGGRLVTHLRRDADAAGCVDWALWCVDGTSVRAHKAAAGAARQHRNASEPTDHALGRSRGGWGTKLHVVTDGAGLPPAALLSAGQAHESRFAAPLLEGVRVTTAQALGARIVLAAATPGAKNTAIAARLAVGRETVTKWRNRFAARGLAGLHDEPRPGARRTITDAHVERVLATTVEETPRGATDWSTRRLAARVGMSQSAVVRIWHAFGL